jgi:L-alanine-DL-glutamate epimerase-like enolase superfamily enzyme
MLKASFKKHTLEFKAPGGTSRGVLTSKDSWYIFVFDDDDPDVKGIGECSIIKGLSIDDCQDFEVKLGEVCTSIENWQYWIEEGLNKFPSIRFGLEMAIKDIVEGGTRLLFPSEFTNGNDSVLINGLVWMGDYGIMRSRIIEKIESGFNCVKLKVGAISFEDEIRLLKLIRNDFNENEIEIRLDANGAFSFDSALEKISRLSEFVIHSIEQPIISGHWNEMASVCSKSKIPVALDEELIGITSSKEVRKMLETILPDFIILKPGLIGGWGQSNMFINEAENQNIGWWVTSALESNIGLNAIAQWTYTLQNEMPQGLGTGQLFSNNIDSPLVINDGRLFYDMDKPWSLNYLNND